MTSQTLMQLYSSPPTGYIVGAFFSLLLLIEDVNFQNWANKTLSPKCCDKPDSLNKFCLRRKNNLFTLLSTAIFLTDYYFAMRDESAVAFYFFIPFVVLRFYALFDMLSETSDEKATTTLAKRNKINPSPKQMNRQLLEFVDQVEPLFKIGFTDAVIKQMTTLIDRS